MITAAKRLEIQICLVAIAAAANAGKVEPI
jgi:hypothetical protein